MISRVLRLLAVGSSALSYRCLAARSQDKFTFDGRKTCATFVRAKMASDITFLSAELAQKIDDELMGPEVRYTLEQLMELAGLSVAQAVDVVFPEIAQPRSLKESKGKILVVVGPGNNGGDGLVAARHLQAFGYAVDVLLPLKPKKEFYEKLVAQLIQHRVSILEVMNEEDIVKYDILVDSIFGFGGKGSARPPYKDLLEMMAKSQVPVVSVDVPSGWNVSTVCEIVHIALHLSKMALKPG